MNTKKCLQCGAPVKSHRKFCSNKCYHDSTRSGLTLACEQCGKSFYRPKCRVDRGERHCSQECYKVAHQAEMVTKRCPVCDKDFIVSKKTANRYNVCSIECRHSSTLYANCERCGRRFRYDKRKPRRHCSEECRRPTIKIKCAQCGDEFRISPSGAGIRRFCSFRCYRMYNGETSIEIKMRACLKNMCLPFFEQECEWLGKYIDFAFDQIKLAIEVDGKYWHRDPLKDAKRDAFLREWGWTVIHFTEDEINQRDMVQLKDLILERTERAGIDVYWYHTAPM